MWTPVQSELTYYDSHPDISTMHPLNPVATPGQWHNMFQSLNQIHATSIWPMLNSFMLEETASIRQAKVACRAAIQAGMATRWGKDLPWNEYYITGGFIASTLQHETPKDIDIYIKTSEASAKTLEILMQHTDAIKEASEGQYPGLQINGKLVTANAITMETNHSFITKMSGDPATVRKTFDYVHTCAYYDVFTDTLYISRAQYDAIIQKRLLVNNFAAIKLEREAKFLKRGYK